MGIHKFLVTYQVLPGFRIVESISTRMMAGIGAFDFDNDGDDDLILCSAELPLKLYRNDGNFRFSDITEEAGLILDYHVCVTAAADLDNDD